MSAGSPGKAGFDKANMFIKLSQSNLKPGLRENSDGRCERSNSSGRGASSNSAGRFGNILVPMSSQLVLNTDRNERHEKNSRTFSGNRRNISGERGERSREYKRDNKVDNQSSSRPGSKQPRPIKTEKSTEGLKTKKNQP